MNPHRNEKLFGLKWSERARPGISGAPELAAEWVAEQSQSVWVLDVRPREELLGPLGHIPGSTWVALEQLPEVYTKLGGAMPVVLVSRTGRRAARAALYLQELGMRYVATLAGGMLGWKAAGFSTSRNERVFERQLEPRALPDEVAPTALTPERIREHVGDPSQVRWVRMAALLLNGKRSCVDGRDEQGVIGTPGGDMGELVLALSAVEAITGKPIADEALRPLLLSELDTFGRFYMHTDTLAWGTCQRSICGDSRLSARVPAPEEDAAWLSFLRRPPTQVRSQLLEHLLQPANMGCGHLKLMITRPDQYEVRPALVQGLVRSFYELLWEGAPEVELAMLDGRHDETAILSVFVDEDLWDFTPIPLVSPSVGSNQAFVAHPQVADRHRDYYVEFLRRQGGLLPLEAKHTSALSDELHQRGGRHLGHTLGHLAKGLPLFEVHFEGTERVHVLEKGRV